MKQALLHCLELFLYIIVGAAIAIAFFTIMDSGYLE